METFLATRANMLLYIQATKSINNEETITILQAILKKSIDECYNDIAIMLLNDPRVDPSVNDNYAIIIASQNGWYIIVKSLLLHPKINPAVKNNEAIIRAIGNYRQITTEILLKDSRVDPTDQNNKAIKCAMEKRHLDMVKLLLPRTDLSKIDDTKLLQFAKENGFVKEEIVTPTPEVIIPVIPKSEAVLTLEKLIANPKCDNEFFFSMLMNIVKRNDHSQDSIETVNFLFTNGKLALKNCLTSNLKMILKWSIDSKHIEIIKNIVSEQKTNEGAMWKKIIHKCLKKAIENKNEELAGIFITNSVYIETKIIELAFEKKLPNMVKLLYTKIDIACICDIRIHIIANSTI